MTEIQNDFQNFSTEEVGDLLKSKRNLIYLFKISGTLIRLFPSSR